MQTYLDHNASSPLHPEVVDAMLPFIQQPVANPSSLHSMGRFARSAIESAREIVASYVGAASPQEVIFTAGGSEANNFLLKGFTDIDSQHPIISTPIEHPSILEPLMQMEQAGCSVIKLPVDVDGVVDVKKATDIISKENPQLMTVMMANNESGSIQPVKSLMSGIDRSLCLTHSDVTQAMGKLPINMKTLNLDALSFSAHKLRGPQAIGALVINRKPKDILISGGAQEGYRRSGTENVAAIVGLGKSIEIAATEMVNRTIQLRALRDEFEKRLLEIDGVTIFSLNAERLPNTSFFSIPFYHGETLLMELDRAGFALASGSACHSEVTQPSHVLKAMAVEDDLALNAVRVSFGETNSLQDVENLFVAIKQLIDRIPATMRNMAS